MSDFNEAYSPNPGRLGDIVELVRDKYAPTAADADVPCINLEDIPEGSGRAVSWSKASDNLSIKTKFVAGDILFCKLRPYLRKYAQPSFAGLCTSELLAFRAKPGVDPCYAYQVVASQNFTDHCVAASFGTKMPRTDWQTASAFPIQIPSETEQRRIANLLSAVDEQISQAQSCIEKILTLKSSLARATLARLEGAPLVPLEKLAEVGSGITLGKQFSGQGTADYPYLRVANVQDGHLDLTEVKTLRLPESVAAKAMLEPGDVLMNEGGDFDKLGRGAVWRGNIQNCLHQNHVFRVRCNQDFLVPEFLALWAASDYGKKFFLLASKQSTNLASINSSQLKKFPVLVPSLERQREVLTVVEAMSESLDIERQELAKLELLKRGLAQRLFTNEVKEQS